MISLYLEMLFYRLAGDWVSESIAEMYLDIESGNRA